MFKVGMIVRELGGFRGLDGPFINTGVVLKIRLDDLGVPLVDVVLFDGTCMVYRVGEIVEVTR